MKPLHKLIKRVRAHPGVAAAIALGVSTILAISAGYLVLSDKAAEESNARKSIETVQFEKTPQDWLKHQRNASEFSQALEAKTLVAVGQSSTTLGLVLYTLKDGTRASSLIPGCSVVSCAGTVLDKLSEKSASGSFSLSRLDVDARTSSKKLLDQFESVVSPLLSTVALLALLGVCFVALMRVQTGMGGAASKLSARPTLRFADVVGNDEAKAALTRVKSFMHDPKHYVEVGAKRPRGVLLVGPPGTGKTLLAQALAGESKANFIAVDGSYFTAMFYGAGVAKVKELFTLARKHAPCVLFIDEVDGIGKRSQGGMGGGESELNRIINRVLVEMDGFAELENVVVVAATNHEKNMDEAMLRPGRFDMLVRVALPTLPERAKLYDMYLGKVVHDNLSDTTSLGRMSAGMSPADIANIVNKAASSAAEQRHKVVTAEHFLRAIETQQLGGEVSPLKDLLTPATRQRLAYHEGGHALVGHLLRVGRVERVTIEPRGQALGVTYITRDNEEPLFHQYELLDRLAMMLAGREAELLVFNSVSSGASDDLKRATELAITMVGTLGFSEAFGLLSVAGVPKELLGPDVQAGVLREARAMLEQSQTTCRNLLTTNRARLEGLAEKLLEREVVAGDELVSLLGEQMGVTHPARSVC